MTAVAALLEELIPFRSDHPRGDERELALYLAEKVRALQPDEVTQADVPRTAGPAGAFVYARWGTPRLLLNAHLDTVPPNTGWSGDPFQPRRENGRIFGLGASDTKGAIAAILTALQEVRPANIGVLFSGDEETEGRCVRAFLESPHAHGLTQAIVCEPTRCRAGTRHRGVLALEISINGPGGHSSRADTTRAPLAELARLAGTYAEWGRARRDQGPPGLQGMCLNVAKLDGGIAFNVIPASAQLSVSVRCPPGSDEQALRAELESIARREIPDAIVRAPVDHFAFETRDLVSFEPSLGRIVESPLDLAYWTEAALFSRAGVDAVVFGPGDIAQAHSPDEWVEIDQLEQARQVFVRILQQSRHGSR